MRTIIILAFCLASFSVAAQKAPRGEANRASDERQEEQPIARVEVEKKYKIVDKNIKSKTSDRLLFLTRNLMETVDTSERDCDYYEITRTQIKARFPLASDEQVEALTFYTLTKALKKVEDDIDRLSRRRAETSSIYNNLTVKANRIFEMVSSSLTNIRRSDFRMVRKIL